MPHLWAARVSGHRGRLTNHLEAQRVIGCHLTGEAQVRVSGQRCGTVCTLPPKAVATSAVFWENVCVQPHWLQITSVTFQ